MPSVSITSANSGRGGKSPKDDPMMKKPAHERPDGPWDDWELSDAAHTLHHAGKIMKNKKFMEAAHKHAEKKAKEHAKEDHERAHQIGMMVKAARISPKALEKMKG